MVYYQEELNPFTYLTQTPSVRADKQMNPFTLEPLLLQR